MTELERLKVDYYEARDAYYEARDARDAACDAYDAAAYYAALAAQNRETDR